MKPGTKKPDSGDHESCYLCDAPIKEIEAVGIYLDDSRKIRQCTICFGCIRAVQSKRLRDQSRGIRSVLEIHPFDPDTHQAMNPRQP